MKRNRTPETGEPGTAGRAHVFAAALWLAATVGLAGCSGGGGAQVVNLSDPAYAARPAAGEKTTFGLDYRDFEYAAKKAVDSFLDSPLSHNPESDGPWVMAISRIVNDTALNIDTDQLVKKIRVALLNSGRVITTTAVGAGGPEDALSAEVRDLRDSELFNQATVAGDGTMVAPKLSLSGKIIQRANRIGEKQQIDYYFQLSATHVATGLAYWEFEDIIAKLGSNESFSWN